MTDITLRECDYCGNALTVNEQNEQEGFLCCGDNYCSEACMLHELDDVDNKKMWDEIHYENGSGECCWTSWELGQ